MVRRNSVYTCYTVLGLALRDAEGWHLGFMAVAGSLERQVSPNQRFWRSIPLQLGSRPNRYSFECPASGAKPTFGQQSRERPVREPQGSAERSGRRMTTDSTVKTVGSFLKAHEHGSFRH